LVELDRDEEAAALFKSLKAFANAELRETAKIDYFATSLPNLLVFEEDLQTQRNSENHLLIALASHGLGEIDEAKSALAQTLAFTLMNQIAADLVVDLGVVPAYA
jgi:hypothetical protein